MLVKTKGNPLRFQGNPFHLLCTTKSRNRYIRPPRPTPDLQTQESLQNPPPRPPQTSSKLRNRYIRPPNPGFPILFRYTQHNNGFELESSFGHSGSKCVKLLNYGEPDGNIDELSSQNIDLSVVPQNGAVTLSFRYAYRKKSIV